MPNKCVVNQNIVCPVVLPYCPVMSPGMRYCPYVSIYFDDSPSNANK